MTTVPLQVQQWIDRKFPKPRVDRDWLQGCYEWAIEQDGVVSTPPFCEKLFEIIEDQLLRSSLSESMDRQTGLPQNLRQLNMTSGPSPVLVEVLSLTEAANSAFQLDQVRKAREERIRGGGFDDSLEGDDDADLEVEGEGPLPKYPRGMLSFVLTDGETAFEGMEYRSIPELSLVQTPIGFKMQLRNAEIRSGIAFLEPNTITLLGGHSDRNKHRDYVVRQVLRERMGLPAEPEPEDDEPAEDENGENDENGGPPPNQGPQPPPAAGQTNVRSPLREISAPLSPVIPQSERNADEDGGPRRRRVPSTSSTLLPTISRSRVSSTTSAYFPPPTGAVASSSSLVMSLSPTLRAAAPSHNRESSPVVSDLDYDFAMMDEMEQRHNSKSSATAAAGPSSQQFPSTSSTLINPTPRRSAFPHILASAPKPHKHQLDLAPEFAADLSSNKAKTTAKKKKGKQHVDDSADEGYEATMDDSDDDPYFDKLVLGSDDFRNLDAAVEAQTKSKTASSRSNSATLASESGPSSQGQQPKLTQSLAHASEIIEIDTESSSGENVDKENMPVPKRQVRQRTESEVRRLGEVAVTAPRATRPVRGSQRAGSQAPRLIPPRPTPQEVFEISDS